MQLSRTLYSVVLLALQLQVQSAFASAREHQLERGLNVGNLTAHHEPKLVARHQNPGNMTARVHQERHFVERKESNGNLTARAQHHHHHHHHQHHRHSHPIPAHGHGHPGGHHHHHHEPHAPIAIKGSSFPAVLPVKQLHTALHKTIWVVEVEAGESKLNLALDAQFTDLVVNAGAYKPSPTAKRGAEFKVERSSDEVAVGTQFGDHVAVAGLSVDGANVASATNKKWYTGADGLLGLAFDWKSEVNGQSPPLFVELQMAGAIKEATLGLALWSNSSSSSAGKPEIILGGRDPSKFKGGVITEIAVPQGFPFWSTPGKLGGVEVIFTLDTQRRTINAVRSVAASIFEKAGLETYTDKDGILLAKTDCKAPKPIFIELGKVKVPVGSMSAERAPGAADADGPQCIVPIAGVDADAIPNGDVMAGAAFFENLYIELSWEKGTVGYAARA